MSPADGGAAVLPALRRAAGRLGRAALDAVLPPRCLSCRAEVAAPGTLCHACWQKLAFLGPPHCAACGLPFPFDPGPGALCADCLRERPSWRRARAVLRYDEASRGLAVPFKHADRTDMAPALGAWLARAGAELLADADVLVPVPLHRLRLIARRYNQAALLAIETGRAAGVAVVPDVLVRVRNTPSQGRLKPGERARNVRGAFAIRRGRGAMVKDRRIVLVDDVLTTGATVDACTRALLKAGAAAVDVLTLARVIRSGAS
jgi:ComF family protein